LETIQIASYIWIAIAVCTMLALLLFKLRAPYGRHSRKGWGKMIANKWGWFIMELPALLIMPSLAIFGTREKDVVSWVLIALWVLHYANRTLIFPFRLNTEGKMMPISIVISAVFFNTVNGALNGLYLGFFGPTDDLLNSPHVIIGVLIFFLGLAINWHSDNRLIGLRQKKSGYFIPEGGLFNYISCPNHFGEMLEWTGFAIVAWNAPALSFAIWSFCNLLPRTLNHHAWYQEYFPNYPKNRKAVIPFLL
jgi:hypothetical protein